MSHLGLHQNLSNAPVVTEKIVETGIILHVTLCSTASVGYEKSSRFTLRYRRQSITGTINTILYVQTTSSNWEILKLLSTSYSSIGFFRAQDLQLKKGERHKFKSGVIKGKMTYGALYIWFPPNEWEYKIDHCKRILSVWGEQNYFFLFSLFMPDSACYQQVGARAFYCPNMSL